MVNEYVALIQMGDPTTIVTAVMGVYMAVKELFVLWRKMRKK